MLRFRKGELNLYKKMLPYELNEYVNNHPKNTEYVKMFLEKHKYDYVKEKWVKGNTI